jgi:hypothetical protein
MPRSQPDLSIGRRDEVEEYNPAHFQWMMVDNSDQSVFAFEREVGESDLLFVYNMTPNYYEATMSAAPTRASMKRSSIATRTSMAAGTNTTACLAESLGRRPENRPYHVSIKLGSYAACIFKRKVAHLEKSSRRSRLKPPKEAPQAKPVKMKKSRRKRSNIIKENICSEQIGFQAGF